MPSQPSDGVADGTRVLDRPCWGCGYSLRGLSRPAHCPECGRPVPSVIHACRTRGEPASTIIALIVALLLSGAILIVVRQAGPNPLGISDLPLVVALVVVVIVGLVCAVRRGRTQRRRLDREVIVTTDGIEILEERVRPYRVGATTIASVRVVRPLLSPLRGVRGVRVGFGGVMIVHHDIGYLFPGDADRLADAIRTLAESRATCRADAPNDPAYPDANRFRGSDHP